MNASSDGNWGQFIALLVGGVIGGVGAHSIFSWIGIELLIGVGTYFGVGFGGYGGMMIGKELFPTKEG